MDGMTHRGGMGMGMGGGSVSPGGGGGASGSSPSVGSVARDVGKSLGSLADTLKDPDSRKDFMRRQRFYLICYGVAFVFLFFVYHLISDGDFSFLLTLGGLTRLFGFCQLLFHCVKDKSCSGMSLKTVQMYAVVFFSRLCSILFYEGYLPYDSSGDWLYQMVELSSFFICLAIIFLMMVTNKNTYDKDSDVFGHGMGLPNEFGPIYLAIPCLVLAVIVHPKLNANFFTDTAWTFALYLETVSVIPQTYMFQKSKTKTVDVWASHFVFLVGLSRFFLFIFWFSSYHELSDKYSDSITGAWVGLFVLINQVLHLVLLGDFCYIYLKSAKSGDPIVLTSLAV